MSWVVSCRSHQAGTLILFNGIFSLFLLCISQFQLSYPPPPPPTWVPGISIFFALDGKFPGVETLELSNPPGRGRKKRENAPSSVNTATFFIDCTSLLFQLIESCNKSETYLKGTELGQAHLGPRLSSAKHNLSPCRSRSRKASRKIKIWSIYVVGSVGWRDGKEINRQAWCTCMRVVVLLIINIIFNYH